MEIHIMPEEWQPSLSRWFDDLLVIKPAKHKKRIVVHYYPQEDVFVPKYDNRRSLTWKPF